MSERGSRVARLLAAARASLVISDIDASMRALAGELDATWVEPQDCLEADVDVHFLEPADVIQDLEAAGFAITSTLVRQPVPATEYPSRRCYVIAQRR